MARFEAVGRLVHVGVRDSINGYVLHLENNDGKCLITEEHDDGSWEPDSRYKQKGSDEEVSCRIQDLWSLFLEEATDKVEKEFREGFPCPVVIDVTDIFKAETRPESRLGNQLDNQSNDAVKIYTRLPYDLSGDLKNGSNCENLAGFILEGNSASQLGQIVSWLEGAGINSELLRRVFSSSSSLLPQSNDSLLKVKLEFIQIP